MAELLSRTVERNKAPDTAPLNAPLFHTLLERLDDGQRAIVLDLGPARTETLALFGQYRCRMEIADVPAGLDELLADQEPDELDARIETLLPAPRKDPVDLVLCWDVLNYFERPALKTLMRAIAARGQPGTLIHALIVYAASEMPARPNRYAAVDEQHLVATPVTGQIRPSPRYTPEDLALCMPDFKMVRAMLLRNGMQEFLFRL